MRYTADEATRAQKLHLVKAAVASALGNGCTLDEVRTVVEAGVDWASELDRIDYRADSRSPV